MSFILGNFSTGPVNISKQVQVALASSPISHRSKDFYTLYKDTTALLCEHFKTRNAFLISGSGTVANEAMIWQIKMLGGKGLILVNGEFGKRLVEQAKRASLNFEEYGVITGQLFDKKKIELEIQQNKFQWVLFCHCETSTGVVNDLSIISNICSKNNCRCYVDCMSTVGTGLLDLSHIAMATASSGKGLASIPGLAIIFSNVEFNRSADAPFYIDLGYYSSKDGIPFTISSNLVSALYVSIKQKLKEEHFKLVEHYSAECYKILNQNNLLPYVNEYSKVFTIFTNFNIFDFVEKLKKKRIIISYQSEYLVKSNLCQIAFFGHYQKNVLEGLLTTLNKAILF